MKTRIMVTSLAIVATALNLAVSQPPENKQAIVKYKNTKSPVMTLKDSEYMDFINSSGETIAIIKWDDGKMEFDGNATPAAKTFFERYLKPIVDEYIKTHCGGEI